MDMGLVSKAFEAYKRGATPSDAARYAFFERLLGLTQGRAEELASSAPWGAPSAEKVKDLYLAPESVLSQVPVKISADDFAATCIALANLVASDAGLEKDAVEALQAFDWNAFAQKADLNLAGSSPTEFFESEFTRLDTDGVFEKIPIGVLATVVSFALRAHLQPAAEEVARVHKSFFDKEAERETPRPVTCPVCGSPASASWVGNTGGSDGQGRMMYCATCGTQWNYDRVRCGNCGSRNENHLHYENLKGDRAHRLQRCEDCGGYHRVVFRGDLDVSPFVMEVEDVAMANLDVLAHSKQD